MEECEIELSHCHTVTLRHRLSYCSALFAISNTMFSRMLLRPPVLVSTTQPTHRLSSLRCTVYRNYAMRCIVNTLNRIAIC